MSDPTDIVSDSRQISLSRDPQLSRDLVAEYDYVDSEQDAITRAMRERVRWGQQNILPEQLLEEFKRFVESSSSGEFEGDVNNGSLTLECAETGAQLHLEEGEETVDVSLTLEDDGG